MKKFQKSKFCPWCQKKEVEKELRKADKIGVELSHGICPSCAEKMKKEL